MNGRIEKLCGFLSPCKSFADVGCDHGYCTKYMLERGLCERAVIADISPKCLQKATRLLKKYIDCGCLEAVCCDGLDGVGACEQALIAGMGGEEIAAILKRGYIPEKFVLQPMRNSRTLRQFLVGNGAEITRDTVIESGGKFYTVIKGVAGGNAAEYNEAELEYGKELKTPAVREYLKRELLKKREYLARIPQKSRGERLEKEVELLIGVLGNGA